MSELEKAIEDFCCGFPNNDALSYKGEVYNTFDQKRFSMVIIELIKGKCQAYTFRQIFIESFKRNKVLNLSDEECEKYADAYVHMADYCREIIEVLYNEKYIGIK